MSDRCAVTWLHCWRYPSSWIHCPWDSPNEYWFCHSGQLVSGSLHRFITSRLFSSKLYMLPSFWRKRRFFCISHQHIWLHFHQNGIHKYYTFQDSHSLKLCDFFAFLTKTYSYFSIKIEFTYITLFKMLRNILQEVEKHSGQVVEVHSLWFCLIFSFIFQKLFNDKTGQTWVPGAK